MVVSRCYGGHSDERRRRTVLPLQMPARSGEDARATGDRGGRRNGRNRRVLEPIYRAIIISSLPVEGSGDALFECMLRCYDMEDAGEYKGSEGEKKKKARSRGELICNVTN
jgi:hypothetical protein